MGAMDAMQDAFRDTEGLSPDLLLILLGTAAVVLLPALLAALRETVASLAMWPMVAGIVAFWWLCITSRPIAGMVAMLAGMAGMGAVQGLQERLRKSKAVKAPGVGETMRPAG